MRINFSDVQVGNFEAVDPGWYLVRITDTEIKPSGPKSKNPGSEYCAITYEVIEPSEVGKKKFWDNASLLPHALFTLKEVLLAVGIDASGELDFDPEELQGKELAIRVNRTKGDDDEYRNEVKSRKPAEVYYEKTGATATLMP